MKIYRCGPLYRAWGTSKQARKRARAWRLPCSRSRCWRWPRSKSVIETSPWTHRLGGDRFSISLTSVRGSRRREGVVLRHHGWALSYTKVVWIYRLSSRPMVWDYEPQCSLCFPPLVSLVCICRTSATRFGFCSLDRNRWRGQGGCVWRSVRVSRNPCFMKLSEFLVQSKYVLMRIIIEIRVWRRHDPFRFSFHTVGRNRCSISSHFIIRCGGGFFSIFSQIAKLKKKWFNRLLLLCKYYTKSEIFRH